MNDNHVFHNNDLQEEKEIQLHSAGYPLKIYLVTPLLNPAEQN